MWHQSYIVTIHIHVTAHVYVGGKNMRTVTPEVNEYPCQLFESEEWMDERCFRPLLCTVKAELGRGQPGLMR